MVPQQPPAMAGRAPVNLLHATGPLHRREARRIELQHSRRRDRPRRAVVAAGGGAFSPQLVERREAQGAGDHHRKRRRVPRHAHRAQRLFRRDRGFEPDRIGAGQLRDLIAQVGNPAQRESADELGSALRAIRSAAAASSGEAPTNVLVSTTSAPASTCERWTASTSVGRVRFHSGARPVRPRLISAVPIAASSSSVPERSSSASRLTGAPPDRIPHLDAKSLRGEAAALRLERRQPGHGRRLPQGAGKFGDTIRNSSDAAP